MVLLCYYVQYDHLKQIKSKLHKNYLLSTKSFLRLYGINIYASSIIVIKISFSGSVLIKRGIFGNTKYKRGLKGDLCAGTHITINDKLSEEIQHFQKLFGNRESRFITDIQ